MYLRSHPLQCRPINHHHQPRTPNKHETQLSPTLSRSSNINVVKPCQSCPCFRGMTSQRRVIRMILMCMFAPKALVKKNKRATTEYAKKRRDADCSSKIIEKLRTWNAKLENEAMHQQASLEYHRDLCRQMRDTPIHHTPYHTSYFCLKSTVQSTVQSQW